MNELFKRIMYQALMQQATDIHLLSKEKGIIRFRNHGNLYDFDIIDLKTMKKLINYIRFISKIDLNYHLRPQTGHYIYHENNRNYNLRISNLTGKDNETLVIRILNNHDPVSLENISKIPQVKNFLNQIVNKDNGLFVISGATGSGKSTTLYALMDEIHHSFHRNIISIEDPIEIDKDYCLQIELNEKQGITYEKSLRQILRHDPDIIMIGEIRDEKTAKLALTCSLTGHLVLTTIHASHCINTMKRLLNLGLSRVDLSDVLIGVMTQKMLYDKDDHLFVLSEFMDEYDIMNYLNKKKDDYFNFHKAYRELIKTGEYHEKT